MHKCKVCGTDFEGKYCPVCGTHYAARWRCPKCATVMPAGTRFCPECGTELTMPGFRPEHAQANNSVSEQEESSSPSKICNALRYVPAALLMLLSAILFALFLAPVIEANGLLISGSENAYEVLRDASLKNLHVILYALMGVAGLGFVVGAGILFVKRRGDENVFLDVIVFIVYAVMIVLGVVLIFKVKDIDKQVSEGLGLLTAGSCSTLIIAFSGAFALIGAIALIARKLMADSSPTSKSGTKVKHVKLAISLSVIAVVAVVLCSLIPTFKLMTVNGTYYASYGGELNKEIFVTLKTGKWTDEKGNTGTYKVDGKAVILYSTDPLTGLQLSLNGAVNNRVLTVGDTTHYQIFVKENHKHDYGEWETISSPTCVNEGTEARTCLCKYAETKAIAATGHKYGNWETTAEPTCTDKGAEEQKCIACGDIKNRSIAALGHKYGNWETTIEPTCTEEGTEKHKCAVCANIESRSVAALGHSFVNGKCPACDFTQLKYTLSSDGKYYTVTGFNNGVKREGDIIIWSEYNNLPVTSIGSSAFWNCSGLTSVTIPDSVTSIGEWAFRDCSGLTSVTIGSGVTSIGWWAFYDCSGLTSVTIPNSVTSIGSSAFRDCSGLTSITVEQGNSKYHSAGNCVIETVSKTLIIGCKTSVIPTDGSVTSIGYEAFCGCSGLTSVTIPNSVTSIGNYAFWECSGLTSVTIPNSVTSIGGNAFSYCSGLTSVTVEKGNPKYHSAGNCVIETASKTLIAGCKTSVIPTDGSVTSIGEYAFWKCSGLTSITIPDSVTSIGSDAFRDCSGLTSIAIPSSVTSIGEYAFGDCSGLTSITIPNSVTSIGAQAFRDCSGLTRIDFKGTKAQWNAMKKASNWDRDTGNYTVYCTDGTIKKGQ